MRLTLLTMALMLSTLPAQGQTRGLVTVEDLQTECEPVARAQTSPDAASSTADAIATIRCLAFTEGIVATVIRLGAAGFMVDPIHESTFCFPSETSTRDWVTAFDGWAEANPDKASLASVDGFLLALMETYPCEGSEESGDG